MKQLVDISSPEGEELECARFLHGHMQEAGIESHLQEVEEGRANVIAIVRGGGDGPTLMLNGHLDTSYTGDSWEDYPGLGMPGPNHRPQSYEIGEGIYGLGANNMKCGVAAAFMTLRALKSSGVELRGHVMASGVVGESEKAPVRGAMRDYQGRRYRGSGHGARYLITHWEPMDYVIIVELIRRKQRPQVIVALGISAIGAALDRQFLSRSSFQYFFESQSAQSDVGNPLPRIVLE